MTSLRAFFGVRENTPGLGGALTRACGVTLHWNRPGGPHPASPDPGNGAYGDLQSLAAEVLARPDVLSRAIGGGRVRPLRRRPGRDPAGGYHVQRSGWSQADERFLVFECGRDHPLRARLTAPGLDVLRGRAIGTCEGMVHARDVAFVDDAYWIIDDRLQGTRPYQYDLRFQLAPAAWERVSIERRAGDVVVHAPGLALVIVAPEGTVRLEPGWVALPSGRTVPAPAVSIRAAVAREATFTTIVTPLALATMPTAVDRRAEGDAVRVVVYGTGADGQACDQVGWGGAPVRLGEDVVCAPAAWLRTRPDGAALAFGAVAPAAGRAPHGGATGGFVARS